jgi:hypothetical protein
MNRFCRISAFLLAGLLLGACLSSAEEGTPSGSSSPGAATPTATKMSQTSTAGGQATIAFTGSPPGEPPSSVASWLTDARTPANEKDAYAVAGDDYANNLYERPFDEDLAYRPDLDIYSASLVFDHQWFYVALELEGLQTGKETPDACFGIELDVTLDGRGEFVIWARPPFTAEWTRENMIVYGTSTDMVGGPRPLLSDAPWKGDTYDKILFDGLQPSVENTAWVRVSPEDPKILQIAFTPEILEQPIRFLWNIWADDGIKDPSRFDYNDVFTRKEAGSPYKWDPEYPPKSISEVDNTCRAPYGFNPVGSVPGGCELPVTPGPTKEGPTPTVTRIPPPK